MCRLLQAIVQQKTENFEESSHFHEFELESKSMDEVQENISYQEDERLSREKGYTLQQASSPVPKRVTMVPPTLADITPTQSPVDLGPGLPIKEGLVEKKGHSVAFLMWPK